MTDFLPSDSDIILMSQCQEHYFHLPCIEPICKSQEGFRCPSCQKLYGVLTGDMPDGTMKHRVIKMSCPGYEGYDSIQIDYYIGGGVKEGTFFSGCSWTAYLPNNPEGKQILKLLKIAFDRKLTFTVGTSVTTGVENTVVWAGIHHKTDFHGPYGYPDATYLTRVRQELNAKGVFWNNSKLIKFNPKN